MCAQVPPSDVTNAMVGRLIALCHIDPCEVCNYYDVIITSCVITVMS